MNPVPPTTPRPPSRWRAVLLALAIFFSGAIAGGAVALLGARHLAFEAARHADTVPQRLAARMRRRLGLDARQEAAVARILHERLDVLLEIRRSVRPRVDAELEALRREIAGELTPRQAAAWSRWFAERRDLWFPPEGPAPPGWPPPPRPPPPRPPPPR